MDDPVETRSNSPPPAATEIKADELKAEISRLSQPEFCEEITRLFGEAKDQAIERREQRLKTAAAGKETSE